MKLVSLFCLSFLWIIKCEGQAQQINLTNMSGKRINDFELDDIKGTPFLTKDFQQATIILQNGATYENVPVKFNMYFNELIFINSKKEESSVDSLKYAIYYNNPDSSSVTVLAAGYPPLHGHTKNSIYEMIGGGVKYHLLKYRYQKLESQKTMGFHHLKEFVNYSDYYIYTKAGGMVKIKMNKNSIIEALPEKEDKINRIIKDKGLDVSKEEDLADLFNVLDRI